MGSPPDNQSLPRKRVLVSGATGFVGLFLCDELQKRDFLVRKVVRQRHNPDPLPPPSTDPDQFAIGEINGQTDWRGAFEGVETVVHLAARVHILQDTAVDPEDAFNDVNVEGTLNFARAAFAAGVSRFIFISSAKVCGNINERDGRGQLLPFREEVLEAPSDPYGKSKWRAENALCLLAEQTGKEVVILRPPLVYGPRVKANFLKLMRYVDQGMPLPFGDALNERSLIYVGNLCDAIIVCITSPKVANQVYMLGDAVSYSTADIVKLLANALQKRPRLINIPAKFIYRACWLTRRLDLWERLMGSLVVDPGKFRRDTGWVPPFTTEMGIKLTTNWYQQTVLTSRSQQ